jgi:hypothetical protein
MFLPLAQKRRSIRKYLDQKVEAEKIDSIVEAVLRAPTSRGRHSWEFVIVTDPGLLDTLSRSRPHGATHLKNAVLGIVVLGNPQICDVWVEDASIASIYIHLAATALDLGSCWISQSAIRLRANLPIRRKTCLTIKYRSTIMVCPIPETINVRIKSSTAETETFVRFWTAGAGR